MLNQVVPLGSSGSGTLTISRGCAFTGTVTGSLLTTAYTSVTTPLDPSITTTQYTTSSFPYRTGDKVQLTSTGTLPTGLSVGTTYYWIANDVQNGLLAASLADAFAKTPVTFSDNGTGVHIVFVTAEQTYTCNGVLDTTKQPSALIPELLSSMSGKVAWTAGQYVILPGYYRTPTISPITRSDLIGPISLQTTMARRDMFNKVKGTFVDPVNGWQPNDFPPISNSAYVTADQGISLWSNIDLPFTDSSSTAQRLAKIGLESTRRQMTLMLQCKLTMLPTRVGDVVPVTDANYGWVAKPFEVIDWTFALVPDANQVPFLAVNLLLRETDAAVYAWTSAEETVSSVAPSTNLPTPFKVAPPTGLTLASGTAYLYLNSDGTVVSPIHLSWAAPTDAFVTSGGNIEIQYRKNGTSVWMPGGFAQGSATSANIVGPQDGVAYDVRIRSINTLGALSDLDGATWSATVSNYTVIGKLQPPTNVTVFSAAQNGNVVVWQWGQIADLDLAGYAIGYGPVGGTAANATMVTSITRGTSVTSAAIPPGTWTFYIWSINTSGIYATSPATASLTVANTNTVVAGTEQAGDFLGTTSGFVRHWTGKMVPDGLKSWSTYTTWGALPTFAPDPVALATYDAPVIDLGIDGSERIWASIGATLLPGCSGAPAPDLYTDFKTGAGSYAGLTLTTVKNITARYLKFRLQWDSSKGPCVISEFMPNADVATTTQTGTLVVAAGGTAITFPNAFHLTPNIQITSQSGALIAAYTSASAIGCTIHVYNTSGSDIGGTVTWQATGP